MSQVTQPRIQFGAQIRAHRMLVLAALLALVATAAVVIALAWGDSQSTSSVSDQPVPAVRGDGGPEETAVAASVGSRSAVRPDESKVAAAISQAPAPTAPAQVSRPDESGIASAISQAPEPSAPAQASRPDESGIASAISRPGSQ